jgi:hypothetical protein
MKLKIEQTIQTIVGVETYGTIILIADFDVQQGAILKSIGQAKGDVIGFSASATPVRIAGPTVNGQVLLADSAEASGLKFGAAGGPGASRQIVVPFDGGGAAIAPDTSQVLTWLLSDFAATEWEVLDIDAANSYIEFLICVDSYANYMPDPNNDLVGIHLGKTRPKLNNTLKAQSTALDWASAVIAHTYTLRVLASGYLGAITFTGAGLNDMSHGQQSRYTHTADLNYRVEIDGTGSPNTFKWSDDGGSTWDATAVSITGADQLLNNGIYIRFAATTGHTATNRWDWTARTITCKKSTLTMLGTIT